MARTDTRIRLSMSPLVEWANRRRFSHPAMNDGHSEDPWLSWARIVQEISHGRIHDAQLYRAAKAGRVLMATAERWAALLNEHPYTIWGAEWEEASIEMVRRVEENPRRAYLLSDSTPFREGRSHRRKVREAA